MVSDELCVGGAARESWEPDVLEVSVYWEMFRCDGN